MESTMNESTLLVVHGTGVRSESFIETQQQIRLKVKEFHLPCVVEPFLWGETLGIDFEGLSLPTPPVHSEEEEAQALRWQYLQIDPLFDLRLWCTPAAEPPKKVLGAPPAAAAAWEDTISKYAGEYAKRIELAALLAHKQLDAFLVARLEQSRCQSATETGVRRSRRRWTCRFARLRRIGGGANDA
jgi:hypothetical protein